MVSWAPPTSTASSTLTSDGAVEAPASAFAAGAPPLMPISSSLYGSPASSARACSSLTSRRENRWPCFTICRIRCSMAFRSSGLNGWATSKS